MNENKTLEYYNKMQIILQNNDRCKLLRDTEAFSRTVAGARIYIGFWLWFRKRYKIFLEQGFYVDATDGSEEMCHIAGNYTGIQVRRLLFEELDENKNMMAYGPARQYFIFLRMNLKPCL